MPAFAGMTWIGWGRGVERRRLLSGQMVAVQKPGVLKVFWLLFFKKVTAFFLSLRFAFALLREPMRSGGHDDVVGGFFGEGFGAEDFDEFVAGEVG